MSSRTDVGTQEKEGNGESGREKMCNEKGMVEQMNRTGHPLACSLSNPLCLKPAKYTPDLGTASLIPNSTGLGGPHSAFSA